MKKYFVETNGYNMVIFADNNGKCFAVHEQAFDERLTLDVAKNADYSNFDGCDTAEQCAYAMGVGVGETVFDTKDALNDENTYTEI